MPSIDVLCGRTSRWDSSCSRSQMSSVGVGRDLQVRDDHAAYLPGDPA